MDAYGWVVLFHVLGVIVWLGTTFAVGILVFRLSQMRNAPAFGGVLEAMTAIDPRLIAPAAGVALLSGIAAAWMGGYFATVWVWIGLAGFVATFVIGNVLTRPRVEKAVPMIAAEGFSDRVLSLTRELRAFGWFDYVVLAVVVADMVLKPANGDWITFLIFAVVLAGGAFLFLVPVFRRA